jgi:hypothetical protein
MTLTLTPAELHEITGTPQHKRQAEWLAERGWKHEPKVDGSMSVLRAEMERHMLTGDRAVKRRVTPDLDALRPH